MRSTFATLRYAGTPLAHTLAVLLSVIETQVMYSVGGSAKLVPAPAEQSNRSTKHVDSLLSELRAQLSRSAAFVRAESFPAVAGDHCRECEFVPVCPIKSAGAVVAQ